MWQRLSPILSLAILLAGCGAGGDNPPPTADDGPAGAQASVTLGEPQIVDGTRRIALQWTSQGEASRFSVWVAPSASQAFEEVATELGGHAAVWERGASWKLDFPTARVRIRGCNASAQCVDSNERGLIDVLMAGVIPLKGAGKVKLSTDGNTLLVVDPSTFASDYYQNPTGPIEYAGHLWIYQRDPQGRWQQEASFDPYDPAASFGDSIALSGDGNTVVIGSYTHSRGSTQYSGAIAVYTRDAQRRWTQPALLEASPPMAGDYVGAQVAVSDDGRRIATNGQRRVYIFQRDEQAAWYPHSSIQGSPTEATYLSADHGLAMSGNGQVIAAATYGGQNFGNGELGSPYFTLRVFAHDCQCGTWAQQADLHSDYWPYPPEVFHFATDGFARGGISFDWAGRTLAVGAPYRYADNYQYRAPGAMYIFSANQALWRQSAQINGRDVPADDFFGRDVSLSRDGRVLAGSNCGYFAYTVGANRNHPAEWSNTSESYERCYESGAVYVYAMDDAGAWAFTASLLQVPANLGGFGGTHLAAMSADTRTIAATASSNAVMSVFVY